MGAPRCACHGELMQPNKGSNGGWRCRVKYRAAQRSNPAHAEKNRRRIYAGRMYLGLCGFTRTETEAMLDGSSK